MVSAAAPGSEVDALKDRGNEAMRSGAPLAAAKAYTLALKQLAPGGGESHERAVLLSNRSAALRLLHKLGKALEDAEACVAADPSWHKGHMRKALVLEEQGRDEEALRAYQAALAAADAGSSSARDYTARIKALSAAINRANQLNGRVAKAKASKSPAEHAVLAWAESKLAYAAELIDEQQQQQQQQQASGSSSGGGAAGFVPELHFLQGSGGSSGGAEPAAVRAVRAFDAPELLGQFVGEMRERAAELKASAVLLIAPKTAVAFPQTWRHHSWPFGAHDGVLVQLQAVVPAAATGAGSDAGQHSALDTGAAAPAHKLLRKLWFIRLREGKKPLEPQEVSHDFELLPTLLKC